MHSLYFVDSEEVTSAMKGVQGKKVLHREVENSKRTSSNIRPTLKDDCAVANL